MQKAESDEDDSRNQRNTVAFEFVSTDDIQNVIVNDKSFQDEDSDNTEFVEALIQNIYE